MTDRAKIKDCNRRQFLASASATATVLSLVPTWANAGATNSQNFESLYLGLIAGAEPIEEHITLTLPQMAESGHNVRFDITVESPMTRKDFIEAIHILAPENPEQRIASFKLSPLSGKAQISGRLRLAKTQNVIALAQNNDGSAYVARQNVTVAVGGCSG